MAQYIEKEALVAELKKRIRDYWSDSESRMGIYPYALEEIIKYVDTLEVKEVDLKKERRNINGTLYYVYPLNWMCLPTANNFPCGDCKCFGGREGNNILCTENWADKPDPNDNYSL